MSEEVNYSRLKITKKDNSFTYSNMITLGLNKFIHLNPNPFTSNLSIMALKSLGNISITNTLGQTRIK